MLRKYLILPFTTAPVPSALLVLETIAAAFMPMLQVFATARFVDTVNEIFSNGASKSEVFAPLAGLMAVVVYTNCGNTAMGFIKNRLNRNLTERLRPDAVRKRASLTYAHIENDESWNLIHAVASGMDGRVSRGFDTFLRTGSVVIRVASVFWMLLAQSWIAALAIMVFTVPLLAVSLRSGKVKHKAYREADRYDRAADYLHTIITGREDAEERALFGYTDSVNRKWRDRYETARKIELKASAMNFIRIKSAALLMVLTAAFVAGVLLGPLRMGAVSLGIYVGLVTAVFNLIRTVASEIPDVTQTLAEQTEYAKDWAMFDQLPETEGALDQPDLLMLSVTVECIAFDNVSFTYPGMDAPVLKNLSMILLPHRQYAFVGVNGAGKTTVTKLLTGLYDNYTGEIRVNGTELRTFSAAQLKGIFSAVFQDFAKYSIPFRDNVMLGNVNRGWDENMKEQTMEALETIGLSGAVERLPQGIDTPLGKIHKDGVDLSGGEWQRLAVARALVSDSPVRILDEPAAALDPVAESRLYEMFGAINKGKSTIFITHRLGAARIADEIFVIDSGYVAEQGSHDALMKRNGLYAKMYQSQRSWYE